MSEEEEALEERVLASENQRLALVGIGVAVVGMTAALVIGLFVWAARKDGEEDRRLQARLGIRRRTRLGR